jgi:ABC-2 type transport system permease protein
LVNSNRIWAVSLRYIVPSFGNRIGSIIYWLTLNIIIWGSTSAWIQQQASMPNLVCLIITGFVLWQIVFRVNLETAKSLFEEITSQNLVNVFASPLKLSEWILGVMSVGLVDAFFVVVFGSAIAWSFYSINFFEMGMSLIFSALLLMMSGWFIGFLICSILILRGKKAQDLVYSLGYVFAPFSCIYYPLSSQSGWIKTISSLLPMTYVFENIRYALATGNFSIILLLKSLGLNIIYLALSIALFVLMFNLSKKRSLASL